MGSAVSMGVNNDDLIDNLLEADYIQTSLVEHVFRAVDRGHYFLPEARGEAYKDVAWKSNHLHMSAPCIYTNVMEGLNLKEGLSFLNLGSGTGYLSTLVGLTLGSSGVNHGIELHEDVVEYAYKRLDEFKKQSGALDEFDFCEPKFVVGNCLCLTGNLKYDRIYCGAGCPSVYESYIKRMLNIGGILVIPLNDQLAQITRNSENSYTVNVLLPVSFATLIAPDIKSEDVDLLTVEPPSLQHLCRSKVRKILRKNIEREFPEEIKRPRHSKKPKRKDRVLRRMTVPIFDEFDSSDEEQISIRNSRAIIMVHTQSSDSESSEDDRPVVPGDEPESETEATVHFNVHDEIVMDTDNQSDHEPNTNDNKVGDHRRPVNDTTEEITENNVNSGGPSQSQEGKSQGSAKTSSNKSGSNGLKDNDAEMPFDVEKELKAIKNMYGNTLSDSDSSDNQDASTGRPGPSNGSENRTNRVKFDSGYGDELDEEETARVKRCKGTFGHKDARWRRINYFHGTSDSDSDNMLETEEESSNEEQQIMVPSPYTPLMKNKIQELPLPNVLKNYLNYYRDF